MMGAPCEILCSGRKHAAGHSGRIVSPAANGIQSFPSLPLQRFAKCYSVLILWARPFAAPGGFWGRTRTHDGRGAARDLPGCSRTGPRAARKVPGGAAAIVRARAPPKAAGCSKGSCPKNEYGIAFSKSLKWKGGKALDSIGCWRNYSPRMPRCMFPARAKDFTGCAHHEGVRPS